MKIMEATESPTKSSFCVICQAPIGAQTNTQTGFEARKCRKHAQRLSLRRSWATKWLRWVTNSVIWVFLGRRPQKCPDLAGLSRSEWRWDEGRGASHLRWEAPSAGVEPTRGAWKAQALPLSKLGAKRPVCANGWAQSLTSDEVSVKTPAREAFVSRF